MPRANRAEAGIPGGGHRDQHDGLDFTDLDHTTADEIAAFRAATAYASPGGRGAGHAGLGWWLSHDSDFAASVLKRYRLYVHSTFSEDRSNLVAKSPSMVALYSLMNYQSGLGYIMRRYPQTTTREEALEFIAVAFLYAGPAGIERVAEMWSTLEWPDAPPQRPAYPDGWGADPGAFRSGLDFRTPGLSSSEVERVSAWYTEHLGEVPPYVQLLVEFAPQVLKDYRNRFENLARTIPKQVVPVSMLHFSCQVGAVAGIRESIQLARGFGVSRAYVLGLVQNACVYSGIEGFTLVDREAGDVLRHW